MKYYLLLIILAITTSCKETVPRKPTKVKTGSFFKESIKRNKELLAKEEKLIQKIILKDSINLYIASSTGSSYYYNTKNELENYFPKTDDLVTFTYNIISLNNDTIYTKSDIGNINYKVDKDELFPGLRNSIKLLKQGETATFLFPSSTVYGYHGDDNKILPNIPVKSTISILNINKKIDSIQN